MKDINFLIEERPFEEGLQKEKKSIPAGKVIAIVMVIAIGIFILLIPGLYVRILEGRASALENKLTDAKYTEVRNVKAQLSNITSKVNSKKNIIKTIDSENMEASQLLLIIQNALPSDCFLTSFSYDGKSVSVHGIAGSSFIAMDFLSNLDRLDLFENDNQKITLNESQSAVEFTFTYKVMQQGGGGQ